MDGEEKKKKKELRRVLFSFLREGPRHEDTSWRQSRRRRKPESENQKQKKTKKNQINEREGFRVGEWREDSPLRRNSLKRAARKIDPRNEKKKERRNQQQQKKQTNRVKKKTKLGIGDLLDTYDVNTPNGETKHATDERNEWMEKARR